MSDEEDFAAMFEASEKARRFERGQTVEGIVVAFGEEVAFVSIGGKSEAQIDLAELKDADGAFDVAIGDRLHAKIISTSGGIVLSRKASEMRRHSASSTKRTGRGSRLRGRSKRR